MSKKKSVSIVLPQDLSKQLKTYQQQQGIESSADAIVAVLQAFFEQQQVTFVPLDRFIELKAQVDRLAEQIAVQKSEIPSVAETPVVSERYRTEPGLNDDAYEDFEDEPDEILYEFLERGDTA